MRLLRDFRCEEGHITERFIDSTIEEVQCGECELKAHKVLNVGTVILDGTDPAFPGAYEKWANVREQRAKITAKKNS